ncbi:MAG: hypothetical protein GY774_35670 [Planctomycetes bacterium]|nr:hypothetical protein [Planctomycetota bacterium]
MIKTRFIVGRSGKELHTYDGYDGEPVLVTTTHGARHGSFVAATRTEAGTTTVISAESNDAIVLTDLVLTTDKVNGATATVIITDGANSVNLIAADLTDAPCNIAISFAGHWQSWRAAYVNLVTVGAVTATLALGYFRIPWTSAMAYGEWDAHR